MAKSKVRKKPNAHGLPKTVKREPPASRPSSIRSIPGEDPIDQWGREDRETLDAFVAFADQSTLSGDVKRAVRLLVRESGEDFEFAGWCRDYLRRWAAKPPSGKDLLATMNQFRDSDDVVEGGEWCKETTDWEMESLPIEKDGIAYGYVRQEYWDGLESDLKTRFVTWFRGHKLDNHDEQGLRQLLLSGRVQTLEKFGSELELLLDE